MEVKSAWKGTNGPVGLPEDELVGDPRFKAILDEMWALHCKKRHDYGSDKDFLCNLRASEGFGIPAWLGALIRGNDKMIRLKTFAIKRTLANEGVVDSMMDLACYMVLARILYEEAQDASK